METVTQTGPRDPDDDERTEAASPRAIAGAPAADTITAHPDHARQSGLLPSSRPRPTAAQALDHADLPRMRAFHLFGVFAPIVAAALSLVIGADPLAQRLFWVGASVMCVSNVALVWLTLDPSRWRPRRVGLLWVIATVGAVPSMMYYFGPFSAVVVAPMLGIVFIGLGRTRWISLSVAAICIASHLLIAVPMIVGWIDDVGVLSSGAATRAQLVVAEILLVAFLGSGYLLGRWARRTNTAAIAELEQAMQLIGDQQQALAEVKDDAQRQRQPGEGRWTGQLLGQFKIGLVLGRGAMGDVYEATAADGSSVAIKLLNAKATQARTMVDRFHREMQVAARLVSPYIVRVIEVSPPDAPVPYIAMERLHGIDLATRLRNESRLPLDELVALIEHVAHGLDVARRAGVVHRDLKPHNLFLHEGTWKILDFGVSKLVDGGEGTLTGDGVVGTPQYMAPEQAAGGTITHRADVYALGAIAYRCLTGRSPFRGRDLSEIVYQVVHTAPIRPSSLGRVSTPVEDVLAVAMAKDAQHRFDSALLFAQAMISASRGRALTLRVPPDAWV